MRRLPTLPGLRRVFARAFLALAAMALWLAPRDARAFCGFYVSGAEGKLLAEARDGTRTVLSMQNDYKGPRRSPRVARTRRLPVS